ncbi:calcipressin protein [Rutstroemia sp. NJR-2017a WRK4]|nr:calcipressin protein [Rutstroemia sp. NJR-2017a WRK4]
MSSTESSPRSSPRMSRPRTPLSLDLSNIPPLTQPTPPSNTLLITNLSDPEIFRADNLQTIRELIDSSAPIHSWAPLKSFRRIIVSFYDEDSAIRIRQILDGEEIMGEVVRCYFGHPTSISPKDTHLSLPDAGKLFFISPPPSPPHGWEMKLEDAPNKQVHAEDLAEALAKLHHRPQTDLPASPMSDSGSAKYGRGRSASTTTIYDPCEHGFSPNLPAIAVEDFTEGQWGMSPLEIEQEKPILAHTARPPVELMES